MNYKRLLSPISLVLLFAGCFLFSAGFTHLAVSAASRGPAVNNHKSPVSASKALKNTKRCSSCLGPVRFFDDTYTIQTGTTAKHSVSLSWVASPSSGVSYVVQRTTAGGTSSAPTCSGVSGFTDIATGDTNTAFVDSTVADETNYCYQVLAADAAGTRSVPSNTLLVQVPPFPAGTVTAASVQ